MACIFTKCQMKDLKGMLLYINIASIRNQGLRKALGLPVTTICRHYSDSNRKEYMNCFQVLGLPSKSDQEQVRLAFLNLVKRFHPDSGSAEADAMKFSEIEKAYRRLQHMFANERMNVNEGLGEYGLYYEQNKAVEEFDIKHTAPQHRQYLTYGGYGSGTPQQRQKQYTKFRAMKAVENVYNHRVSKIRAGKEEGLVQKDKREAQKIKMRSEMDRLVEDLIQESMSRGEFENLSGYGKPLKNQPQNPYVDFVTHKMNQVLIDNGFTPEWITLQKEIADETKSLRESLALYRGQIGRIPLSEEETKIWDNNIEKHKVVVQKLNSKIDKFNLLVPILQKQKLHISLEREAKKVLEEGKTRFETGAQYSTISSKPKHEENPSFLEFFSFFSGR